jgi:hypothetical protein
LRFRITAIEHGNLFHACQVQFDTQSDDKETFAEANAMDNIGINFSSLPSACMYWACGGLRRPEILARDFCGFLLSRLAKISFHRQIFPKR